MPLGCLGRDVKKGVSYANLEQRRPVRNGDRDTGNTHVNQSQDEISRGERMKRTRINGHLERKVREVGR